MTGDFIHVLGHLPNTRYTLNTNTTRIFEWNFCTTLPHVDYANILNFNLFTFGWTRTQTLGLESKAWTRARFFGKVGLDFTLPAATASAVSAGGALSSIFSSA